MKKWKVAEYLRDKGCFFHHVYERDGRGGYAVVAYPETMAKAVEFVRKFRDSLSST